jgi:hypothetical protein
VTSSISKPDQYNHFDHVAEGVFLLQNDMVVLFWNKCLELWTGIPREAIVGSPISSHFPHFEERRFYSRLQEIFAGGPPVLFSSQIHRQIVKCNLPDGRPRIQKGAATALPVDQQPAYHALVIINDVSDLTYINEKYHQTQVDLLAANKRLQN